MDEEQKKEVEDSVELAVALAETMSNKQAMVFLGIMMCKFKKEVFGDKK